MKRPTIGYIEFSYLFDDQIISLGGAGFCISRKLATEWVSIPQSKLTIETCDFLADRLDKNRDIVETKPVDKEIIEFKLGEPIEQLIANGRRRLAMQINKWEKERAVE